MVLLLERGPPDADDLRLAIAATFAARGTHPLAADLPTPPDFWATDFPGMAGEAGLSTADCLEAFAVLKAFWASHDLGSQPTG